MKTISSVTIAASLGLLLFFSGCASTQPTHSGFLSNYDRLVPVAGSERGLEAATQVVPRTSTIEVAPVVLRIDSSCLSDERAHELQSLARQELQRAIAAKFPEGNETGENRPFLLETAITRVDTSTPILNVFTTLALLVPINNGGVCLEWKLIDRATGRSVAQGISVATGKPWDLIGALQETGHARSGLTAIADEIASALSKT